MDPFTQGEPQTEEDWCPRRHSSYTTGMLGGEPNAQHSNRPIEEDYEMKGPYDDDDDDGYCPHCQRSEVLRDFCSCANTERGQRTDMRCDCMSSCSCTTCKPWRHAAPERGGADRSAAYDAGMTSSSPPSLSSVLPSNPHRRHQSRSLHENIELERGMAIAARDYDIRNIRRRRTMSFGAPSDIRFFMKHSVFCECRGSGVGCQCGRMCHCD